MRFVSPIYTYKGHKFRYRTRGNWVSIVSVDCDETYTKSYATSSEAKKEFKERINDII